MASPSRSGLSSSLSARLPSRIHALIRSKANQWASLEAEQIRLVTLLPGQRRDALCVKLNSWRSGSTPPYAAVSYAWGKGEPTEDLRVANQDDAIIKITKNLKSALRHMRSATDDIVLWIDQICINQRDPIEKSHQVSQMMARIYERADRLLIWLGDESEDSKLAFETIREACKELEAKGRLQRRSMAEEAQGLVSILDPAMAYVTLHDEKGVFKYRAWLAVVKLLGRPWFHRLWVRLIRTQRLEINVFRLSKKSVWPKQTTSLPCAACTQCPGST